MIWLKLIGAFLLSFAITLFLLSVFTLIWPILFVIALVFIPLGLVPVVLEMMSDDTRRY